MSLPDEAPAQSGSFLKIKYSGSGLTGVCGRVAAHSSRMAISAAVAWPRIAFQHRPTEARLHFLPVPQCGKLRRLSLATPHDKQPGFNPYSDADLINLRVRLFKSSPRNCEYLCLGC